MFLDGFIKITSNGEKGHDNTLKENQGGRDRGLFRDQKLALNKRIISAKRLAESGEHSK